MELNDLEFGLKQAATAGHTLNCQELLGLQSGLAVLKAREKLELIYFWGKLFGQQRDYYIAYGMAKSTEEFPSKTFYFATEDFGFAPLKQLTEEAADLILELQSDAPFSGDPDAKLVPQAEGNSGFGALVELDRLTQVVQEIDFDTAAVPKGSFALNEAHAVTPSSDFRGLNLEAASKIESYVHFRPPTSVQALKAIAETDQEFYSNFLDPLENDLPKGCWTVRKDQALMGVTLRSLTWPGYVAYHIPGTNRHGGLYYGYGNKSRDLPFIL